MLQGFVLAATLSLGCAVAVTEDLPDAGAGGSGGLGSGGLSSGTGGRASGGTGAFGTGGVTSSGGTVASGGTGGSAGSAVTGGTGGAGVSGGSGGTGGTGVSGGSGGTGVSGGTGGTGTGSTGTGGEGGTSEPTDGFSVEYEVLEPAASATSISSILQVVNVGPETVPVSELTLRYYYTSEVVVPTTITIWWSHIQTGGGNITLNPSFDAVELVPATATADSYVEFSFDAGAPSIAPDQSALISWKIQATSGTHNYDQSNDYSFDASKSVAAPWDRVVLLRNGSVIWGLVP